MWVKSPTPKRPCSLSSLPRLSATTSSSSTRPECPRWRPRWSCRWWRHSWWVAKQQNIINFYRLSIVKSVCAVNGCVITSSILFRWNYWSFPRSVTSLPGASPPSAPRSKCHGPSRSSPPSRRLSWPWGTWRPAWCRGTRCSRRPRSLSTAAANWTPEGGRQIRELYISEDVIISLFIKFTWSIENSDV